MNDPTSSSAPWVLVEGPGPGDAEFLGRWLLAAVEAEKQLAQQFNANPALKKQIERLEVASLVSFSSEATHFVSLWTKTLSCFSISLWDEWGEMFAVMAEIGFFTLTGDRYQMTVPKHITGRKIEKALLRIASTEDEAFYMHPEYLVSFLSAEAANVWQEKLDRIAWMQRVADRALLLEEI